MEEIIIGTSCYENAKGGNTVSVTGDGGNFWGYYGPSYKKLAPSLKLYEYWRDNPDNLSDEALIEYYIEEYYNHRLKNLDTLRLLYELKEKFGNKIILLCHEMPNNTGVLNKKLFCHRRLDADYIELTSGIVIPEVSVDINGVIKEEVQLDYKTYLKKIIK